MLAGFAQFDNDIRAMRTVQGMRKRIQDGIAPWKSTPGYRSTTRHERKTKPDEPDQPLFGLLKRAWEYLATGAYTKADIRRLMASWGITSKSGSPLSPQAVDKIFKNSFYAGVIVDPWSGEEHQGRHLPMISRDTFLRVQRIIAKRNRSVAHQRARAEFPVRGLARCQNCNFYLTGSFSRGRTKRYPYYHCQNRNCRKKGHCFPVGKVDAEFFEYLAEIAPAHLAIRMIDDSLSDHLNERAEAQRSRTSGIRKALHDVQEELQNLIHMRAGGLIDDTEFRTARSALLIREAAARQTAASLDELRQAREMLAEISSRLQYLPNTWIEMQPAQRARFQRKILPAGYPVHNVRTAERGLIFNPRQLFPESKTTKVTLSSSRSNQICKEIKEIWNILNDIPEEKEGPKRAVRRKHEWVP